MEIERKNNHVHIQLDSDAFIVRGLIAILFSLFQHRTPQEIAKTDVEGIFGELNLINHLSPTRGNGLRAMVQRIKQEAQVFATQS